MSKKINVYVLLVLIMLLGAYLRLNNFHDLARFNVDQARDAEVVDLMLEKNDYPLVGPKAGGTPFLLGPAFFYMEYLSAFVFGNDPSGLAFFVPILSILSIPIFFIFLHFYFSNTISLYLSFIYAISFFSIKYSRFAWNPNVVPFFLFLFLISILKISEKSKKGYLWTIILGISLGIGVQLHTFLLILMPIVTFICLGIIHWKEKKEFLKKFLVILVIGLILNASFFIYDFQNNWENTQSFFHGAENKTDKNQSLISNVFLEGQFFIEGFRFVLSGYEPQSNLTKMIDPFKWRYFKDILAIVFSVAIFLLGLIQTIRYYRLEKNEKKRNYLRLYFLIVFLSVLLFFPVAQELNVRFYITIIFLPFLLFGIVIKYLKDKLGKQSFAVIMAIMTMALIITNISTYKLAYDFTIAEGKSEIYGGISLKEAEDISEYLVNYSKKYRSESKTIYIFPFEYSRSLGYFIKKSNLDMQIFYKNANIDQDLVMFFIGKSKNEKKIIEENSCCYTSLDSKNMGRFTIIVFESKK